MGNTRKQSGVVRWGRRAGIVLLVMIGLFLILQLSLNYWAAPRLKKEVSTALSGPSGDLKVEVGDIDLSVVQRRILVSDITVHPTDSSAAATTRFIDSLSIGTLSVSGIDLYSWLSGNGLKITAISVNNPFLRVILPSGKQHGPESDLSLNRQLYNMIQPRINALQVDEFRIEDFTGSALRSGVSGKPAGSIRNLDLTISGIRIDSATAGNNRLLPVRRLQGTADSLVWHPEPGLYECSIADVEFSSYDSTFSTGAIALSPKLPKYAFARALGHETDRIELLISRTEWEKLDFQELLRNRSLAASALLIGETRLELFHDKKMPSVEVNPKTYPHVKFRELDFPVRIDSVIIENTDITYGEHKNLVPEPGMITFTDTRALFRNVYNRSEEVPGNRPMTMNVTSFVQGEGRFDVNAVFPFNGTGAHHLSGSLGAMKMQSLEATLKYLAYIKISDGMIHSMEFDMELGDRQSSGTVLLHYTGLNINVIEFKGLTEQQEFKELKSFIANTFMVKGKNTPPLREGAVSFQRARTKSIFNYWWKSLLSGLTTSAGR